MIERSQLLKDLRNSVLDITKKDGSISRVTLSDKMLPQKNKDKNKEKERSFHESNEDKVAAWSLSDRKWITYEIDDISYVQIIDNYF